MSAENLKTVEVKDIKECIPYKDSTTVTWINVDGIEDIEVIKDLGDCFGIHSLSLEDILNTDHRPKLEEFDNYVYIVLKNDFL